jgi:hypothetical protein
MSKIRDYTPWLREAIAEARAAGLEAVASELERACFAEAYTTSSEMIGQQGQAIKKFLKATQGKLPQPTRAKLNDCLGEIAKVWPARRDVMTVLRGLRLRS